MENQTCFSAENLGERLLYAGQLHVLQEVSNSITIKNMNIKGFRRVLIIDILMFFLNLSKIHGY
jgi:hypothetical protein